MKKLFLILGLLVLPALAHAEGKFIVGSTNNGQYTDLQVTGANSTTTKKVGLRATIDLGSVAQTSASLTTTPVIALSQTATVAPVFGITCTNGGGVGAANTNTCASYTTTAAAKIGSIKIYVNGVAGYVDVKSAPN